MTKIKRKPLLSTNNAKTIKGEKLGYMTYILYMTPFTQNSKGINVCSHASKGCAEACLVGSGNARFEVVRKGRLAKTEYFLSSRLEFLTQIKDEIAKIVKKQEGKAIVTIRLNGTSDLAFENFRVFEGKNIFEVYPEVQFYDYTKNYLRFDKKLPSNYHLTFSRSEVNHNKAMELLKRGFNVAMVFDKLIDTFEGYKVINGDNDDLRFLDEKNVIVGLRYKKLTGKGVDNSLVFKSGFGIETGKYLVKVAAAKLNRTMLLAAKERVLINTANLELV